MATSKAHHEADATWIKASGNKITFYPRGLKIVWGDDDRYWELPNESDTPENCKPAELKNVSWLEVTGSADVEPGKKYEIYFELSFTPEAAGWNDCEVYLITKLGRSGKNIHTKVGLKDKINTNDRFMAPSEKAKIEVPASSSGEDRKLSFGLYEVWSGKWKKGLQIHKAVVEEV